MLLRFGVSNHLSIKDYQELSFVASSLKDPEGGLIDCPAAPTGAVLPAVVVYGANAAGKSNLFGAIQAMCTAVLLSHRGGEPGTGISRQPFRLAPESRQAPTLFDIDFVLDGVRHHYGFESTDERYVSEWLYTFPKAHRRTAFVRDGEKFKFGRSLKSQNSTIAKMTRPNSLFLSAAAQNHHQQLSPVYSYFRSISIAPAFEDIGIPLSKLANKRPELRTIEFLKKAGTGVVGYREMESEIPENIQAFDREFFELDSKHIDSSFEASKDVPEKEVSILLSHQNSQGKFDNFELDIESGGTLRLLVVLQKIYRAIDHGCPVLLDEIDMSLHTRTCEAILELFCSKTTNPRGAQILATTHDTNLMKSRSLRRDQLWFAEKGSDGATQIYALSDYRTRQGDNLEKGYLQGRYGAVPHEAVVSHHGET